MRSEWFRLFAKAGEVYKQRFASPQWETYPTEAISSNDRDKARLNALLLVLEGYAFERAGCPPYFSGLAVDVLAGIGTWPPDEHEVWKRFKYALSQYTGTPRKVVRWSDPEDLKNYLNGKDLNPEETKGTNSKANPLAPKGTEFRENGKLAGSTSKESIVGLAAEVKDPLDLWVRDRLERETENAYSKLSGVSGIADKIATYFMRDVARHYGVFPPLENENGRKCLQPIDLWERRTVQLLREGGPPKDDGECKRFIVQNSRDAGCSPEIVNQGIWYFGSQIAETEYCLHKAMTSPDGIHLASDWLESHLCSLKRVGGDSRAIACP